MTEPAAEPVTEQTTQPEPEATAEPEPEPTTSRAQDVKARHVKAMNVRARQSKSDSITITWDLDFHYKPDILLGYKVSLWVRMNRTIFCKSYIDYDSQGGTIE